jgi:hypothetical protein
LTKLPNLKKAEKELYLHGLSLHLELEPLLEPDYSR